MMKYSYLFWSEHLLPSVSMGALTARNVHLFHDIEQEEARIKN